MSFNLLGSAFALHFANRAIKHLRVELETDGFDVAALLASKQVSRTAELKIKRRDFEAGAQIGKFLESGEAAARDGRQLRFRGNQQIGVGAAIRAADPAAKLIEF